MKEQITKELEQDPKLKELERLILLQDKLYILCRYMKTIGFTMSAILIIVTAFSVSILFGLGAIGIIFFVLGIILDPYN